MLSIRNLSKTYRNGVRALHDVSLEIPKGMFGLLGPNGAGKSTLMRTIATLQAPDSGTVAFDGIDVLRQPELLRRQLGYAPQEFGVYPRISGRAMLDQCLRDAPPLASTPRSATASTICYRALATTS